MPKALFKSGGCLDLMLAVDPEANPRRTQAGPGDLRLLITRVGGDEEQFCGGFWPGDERLPQAAFFAYWYPKRQGVERSRWWNDVLGELLLPYDDVRASNDPRQTLLAFLDEAFDESWAAVANG